MKVFEGYKTYGILGYFITAAGFFLVSLNITFAFLMILGIVLIGYGWFLVGSDKKIEIARINGVIIMLMIIIAFVSPFFIVLTGNLGNIIYVFYCLLGLGVASSIVNILSHFKIAKREGIKYFEYSAYLRVVCLILSVIILLDLFRKVMNIRTIYDVLKIVSTGENILLGVIFLVYGIAYALTVYGWTRLEVSKQSNKINEVHRNKNSAGGETGPGQ